MKPYGREKKVNGDSSWKQDYHLHEKNKKLKNWWEEICECISRKTIKQNINKEISEEILERKLQNLILKNYI